MSKTTITNGSRQFNIPSWIFETGKVFLAASVAIGLVYIRMASLEKDVRIMDATLVRLSSGGEARQELISDNRQRISTIEVKGSVLDKAISESLARIEAEMKDLRADVKELQKRR